MQSSKKKTMDYCSWIFCGFLWEFGYNSNLGEGVSGVGRYHKCSPKILSKKKKAMDK